MGMGKKRSYNDTGFSSDNNGSGFGPPPNSYMKTEFGQEDYGYGGPWPDYDMNYGPPHKTHHEAPRDNEEDMLSSMGLPTSFTASIDQSMENFAEDIPLEAKGRNNTQGAVYQTPIPQNQFERGGRGGRGRGQNKRGQGRRISE